MKFQTILFVFVFLTAAPSLAGAGDKLTVYSVNYPLHYFAERIGGEKIEAVFPAPQEVDPAFWNPDEDQVRHYQSADIILLNGAGYARWVEKVSLPLLRSINTSKAFRDNYIITEATTTHSHGPQGDHSHGGTAFTTWLDFSLAAVQAEAVYKSLTRFDPANGDYYKENFTVLESELLELDQKMSQLFADQPAVSFFASHPIYQYMAQRYGMDIRMLTWEPGEDPGLKEWQKLQDMHQHKPGPLMIWEGTPLSASADRLGNMGIAGLVFSPCYSMPAEGDFLEMMQTNIKTLEAAVR